MKCSQCEFQTEAEIKFCPNCGSRVTSENGENRIFHIEDDPGFASRDSEYIRPSVQPAKAGQSMGNRRGPDHSEGAWQGNGQDYGQPDGREYSYPEMEEESSEKSLRRKPFKELLRTKVLLALGTILAVGILAYTFILKDKLTSVFYELSSHAIQVYSTGDKTLILNRKGEAVHSFDQFIYTQYSSDKSAAMIYLMKPNESGNFEQYYVNEEDSKLLSNINSVFEMSADGRYLFYSLRLPNNRFGLYQYDRKTKKEYLLIETKDKQFGVVKVSPDGKTLTYTLIPTELNVNDSNDIETFLMKEGKDPESLGEDKVVMAVSNNAEYLYFCDYENNTLTSLYARYKGEDVKLLDYFNMNYNWINEDYSEMLYSDGSDTYLYHKGDKVITIAGTEAIEILLPYQYQSYIQSERLFVTYNSKTFLDKLIRCSDGTVRRINKKGEAERICRVDPESQIALSSDGDSLLYTTSEGSIQKVSDISGKCRETDLVDQMNSFITTADLSQVYYLIGDELFYKEGNNEAIKISEGVNYLMSNGDYTGAFFQTDIQGEEGVLNYSSKGSEPEHLFEEAYAAELTRLDYGCAVKLTVFGGNEYYYNSRGSEMMRIEDEIK